jgi:hypothetical protein
MLLQAADDALYAAKAASVLTGSNGASSSPQTPRQAWGR